MKNTLLKIIISIFFLFNVLYAQDPGSFNNEGVEKSRDQDYNNARKDFRKAARIYDEESARVLHNRGLLFERRGQIDEAMASYKEAISRNPKQSPSYERLGYWHYMRGNYETAVFLGEKSLELNPKRETAKKWLYDAYQKKIENVGGKPLKKSDYYKNPSKKKAAYVFKVNYPSYNPYSAKFYGTFDCIIRTRIDSQKSNDFSLYRSEGPITNFPYKLQAYYRPYQKLGFFGLLENPQTGAANPNLSGQSERFEARYYFGKLIVGGGLLLHHYEDDDIYGSLEKLTDFKFGSSVYYEENNSILELLIYPRLLLLDGSWSTGKTMDTSVLEYKYTYKFKPDFNYHVRFNQTDFYYFDHSKTVSNYWGYFDAALGCSFNNYSLISGVDLVFNLEVSHRMNLEKTNVKNPYDFFNGQGLLGFDSGMSGGSLFSGQESDSTLFNIRVDERITPNFFLYQSVIIELVGYGENHHEFNLQLGAGYLF